MVQNGDATIAKTGTLSITYGLFLIGFFFIPERSLQYLFYYLAVLLPFLPVAWRHRQKLLHGHLVLVALGYIAYLTLSMLWSDPLTWRCAGFMLARGLLTASFLLITACLLWRHPDTFHTLLKVVTVCAALFGLISIVIFYSSHPFPTSRMVSFAQIDNPNTMGVVTGLFALLAVNFVLAAESVKVRLLYSAAAIILLSVVLLTQSRNAFLATSVGLLALFSRRHGQRSLVIGVLLLALLIALFITPLAQRFGEGSATIRTGIWASTLAQIAAAPLFGHGQCSGMQLPSSGLVFTQPHSVYLATAWHGGLIGLLLLLSVLIAAFRQALNWRKQHHESLYLALVVYMAVAISVDFGSIITRPREAWLYFWLPVALTAGVALRSRWARPGHPS